MSHTRPSFHDTIAAGLPRGRDDEPSSLRQDILDELNDHLECAWRREVLRGGTAAAAPHEQDSDKRHAELWQRVEQRFGDPRALARRLWLDAMWNQIMNQRLQLVAMFVLAVASLGSLGLAWQTLAASRALAEQSQASNAELLKELRGLVTRLPVASQVPSPPAEPAEWNRVRIRCVAEKEVGKPLAGVAVTCGNDGNDKVVLTDREGLADLGLVHSGPSHLTVSLGKNLERVQMIQVNRGEDYEQTVVCPPADATASVSLSMVLPDVEIPASLKARIWHHLELARDNAGAVGTWSAGQRSVNETPITVLVAPDGKLWQITDVKRQLHSRFYQESDTDQPVEITPRPGQGIFAKFAASRIDLSPELQPVNQLTLPLGRYYLKHCSIAVSDDSDSHALFVLPPRLTLSTLVLDGVLAANRPDLFTVPLFGTQPYTDEDGQIATWPRPDNWSIRVLRQELEAILFLAEFSPEAVPTALVSEDYRGKKVPALGASDRVDFLLDDKVILSGVPVRSRHVQIAPLDLNGGRSPTPTMYLFSSLMSREVDLFRQIQQGSWGTSVAPRFKIRIRPGTAEEVRGSLPADFEEQLKKLPRPLNETT